MSKVSPKQNFNFVRDSCHSSDDESESYHGSDDDESDDEDAPELPTSPQAQPHFVEMEKDTDPNTLRLRLWV